MSAKSKHLTGLATTLKSYQFRSFVLAIFAIFIVLACGTRSVPTSSAAQVPQLPTFNNQKYQEPIVSNYPQYQFPQPYYPDNYFNNPMSCANIAGTYNFDEFPGVQMTVLQNNNTCRAVGIMIHAGYKHFILMEPAGGNRFMARSFRYNPPSDCLTIFSFSSIVPTSQGLVMQGKYVHPNSSGGQSCDIRPGSWPDDHYTKAY